MIRLICFDIDDTLMDFHKGEKIAFFQSMEEHGETCSEEEFFEYEKLNAALRKALERGEIEKNRLKVKRFEDFKEKCNKHFDAFEMSTTYIKNLSNQCFLFDGAKEVVEKCAKDYDLAVTTNGISSIQRNRLKLSGLHEYFKYLFISEEMGYSKPQSGYYEEIFNQSHVKPEEIMIIGDSLSADVLGAINSGCKSVWYNPKHLKNDLNLEIDYIIEDLNEIFDILEENK